MNQGRIWCVVSPNVGLPLLLGSVTALSLIVHGAVMSHTSWMSSYWQGGSKAKTAENVKGTAGVAMVTPQGAPGYTITVTPSTGTQSAAQTAFVVTVTPTAPPSAAPSVRTALIDGAQAAKGSPPASSRSGGN